ncbi:unnamed protein product [Rotaria sordida]|uniref:Eukaryotic translation initiation factor 4 gamma n=1 Tax=Rotaria sordida TaxID=392033 RepID=A0A814WUN5_9BILA|nr:unnamed protein product [Rotaria sordida]
MQSMNTDQQTYYPNSPGTHPAAAAYYLPNGIEHFSMTNSNTFPQSQHMAPPFYNPSGVYGQQAIYIRPYLQAPPFHPNNPRAQNPSYVPIIRPPNETSNGTPGYIPSTAYPGYGNSNIQPAQHMYAQSQFYRYATPQTYSTQNFPQPTSSSQISNQSQSQLQYSTANNQQATQSSQTHQTQTSQSSSIDQSHGILSQPSQSKEKRQKKPIPIVDPVSQKALEIEGLNSTSHTSSTTTTTTNDDNRQKDSTTDSKEPDETNKTQTRQVFLTQFARLLDPTVQTDKNGNQSSTDDLTDEKITKEKQTEDVSPQSDSTSLTKSAIPNELVEQSQPGSSIRSTTEDKSKIQDDIKDNNQDQNDSQKQLETVQSTSDDTVDNSTNQTNNENVSTETVSSNDSNTTLQFQAMPSLSNTESVECVTPPETPISSIDLEFESTNIGKTPSISRRHSYTKQELLNKRLDPVAQKRPMALKSIDGVTDPPIIRSISNNITRGSNISIDKPPLSNRSDNPYTLADRNKIDLNIKFLRDIKSILNKVTPQTYDKLLKQLDELELDRYERLDGMITNIFSKAVDEPKFSFLYARLCQFFQRKQVTVPDENGQRITHSFRQLLLTRCQKEFENDYRQEIGYEKRKSEVETITDEKIQKEESEKLEEDLAKAKRKKLGNIFFIGELFKLQMLTDTIMYDCIEYLLRDKTDEESIECLCKLLNTIGKELDAKTSDKSTNRKNLEKHYNDLESIITQRQTSARIRFMIQDVMDFRKANWVARRIESKPTTIDEIHEQERIKREQQERDQERDKAQRRESNRTGGNNYGNNNSQQYTESRGARGSSSKQQSNRTDDEQSGNRFNVNSVRQLQSNDKRNQGPLPLNLAPQGAWSRGSAVEKKPENDRSNTGRNGKPPTGPVQQLRSKTGASNGTSAYPLQSQTSRELLRENSMESSRKASIGSGVTSPNNISMTHSREGSRNVSREQSRESNINERVSNVNTTVSSNKTSASTINNTNLSKTSFDEEKTMVHVHSLIEEYTENYSDDDNRPINEAIEDLRDFCISNINQQALIIRELFTNVLEAKPRARKAIGHLLDIVLHQNIISNEAFLSGFKMVIDLVPDFAVDIPLIWQYIGEILGAFIGGPTSNMLLLKSILQIIPDEKCKQLFQYIIRYAIEFSSKSRIQRFWQSSDLSLNDLFKSDSIDSSFINEYNWLSETIEAETTTTTTLVKENLGPCANVQLVRLFKSVNDQGTVVTDSEIITYIQTHMNSNDKYYIRNIVLSYLEACLINREPQKKIQEDIAKNRMTVLKKIIEHKPDAEIQAVYAIQNFVNKLEHPPKMAQLLFDIFYDEECVSEDAFFEWLRHPDPSETEGHSVVEISTKDFFTWLEQAEVEMEEGEEEGEAEEES